ncbi:MAG: 2-succinyl-5-enolpyruvyl-6-hydroxy-3-cyclohexene-1-carboxylic-acid synthase [Balneolaceae bacterium]|nr:2-succinyl-5-enolpyruvyl-6-hydroxy-3-cyclohexene-1-carboxylic-acid synthase [Balneolaceae bacterium]
MPDADVPSGNLAFDLCNALFRALYRLGLRHVVISPGSRSTPLVLAASVHPGLEKHVILDERSAAFTALGIGKATGRPAVLVCTSGTALANYFPAVIEARMSGVPLLLATADRPPQLVGTGANQTIRQDELYGDYPVRYASLLSDGITPEETGELARKLWNAAREGRGPAHLNAPFDKPLEPDSDRLEEANDANARQVREVEAEERPGVEWGEARPAAVPDLAPGGDEKAGHIVPEAPLAVVIQGPLSPMEDPGAAARLARRLNAPLLSETGGDSSALHDTSDGTAVTGFEGFLRDGEARRELRPQLILRFGFQPVSKALEYALRAWEGVPHWHLAHPSNSHDITVSVTRRLAWDGHSEPDCRLQPAGPDWLAGWRAREEEYARRRGEVLGSRNGETGSDGTHLGDGQLYHRLLPQVPPDWFAFFSNSFPVRDRLLCGPPLASPAFVSRGASGIDGITSTAMGIALASGKTGVLFTGDLAFLHDTNALLGGQLPSQPLIVIIVNNGGGSIFRMLPIAERGEVFRLYFETPQQADIRSMAGSYGLPYTRIETPSELSSLDLQELARQTGRGLHLVECRTDAEYAMNLRRRLWGIA